MKHKILFVCHGNICRSPMAEFIMKSMVREAGRADEFEIDSVATSTEELGNDIYPQAKACLRRHGITFTHHAARQVTRDDYRHFDHIYLMDTNNFAWLARLMPDIFLRGGDGWTDAGGKCSLLMTIVGERRDVADPWYTDDFEATYRDITQAVARLLFYC